MDLNAVAVLALLLLLASSALAQDAFTEWALKDMQWRIESIVKLLLCAIWAITAATLTIVVIISGIRYLSSQDADEKDKAKKNIKQGFVGLIIIVAACPFVNYLVHGTDVAEFKCDCIPLPPPTTTTTTTTTIPTGALGTRPTTTTTTTTTTTVTTMQKSGGGRFLLVGNMKYSYDLWPSGYYTDDIYGVIFNMDGTIYKDAFKIDKDKGPAALTVGPNRFFVAYGGNAVVLDWEGQTVKTKFETKSGYVPVKAIYTKNAYYLLLTPYSGGGGIVQAYGLNGEPAGAFNVDTSININGKQAENYYFFSEIIVPEGDMAFYEGNLLIVWYDKSSSTVYGISYDLNGKKSKEKFAIGKIDNPHCIHNCIQATFVNPQVEAGKYFMVAFDGKIFLYDKKTLNQVGGQKTITLDCQNDMAYGDGKYLVAQDNDALFLDEEGNKVGEGTFGGHSDVFTHLAYGNKMFVGIVAIHTTDDGIGASFLDYNGKHLIDTLPLAMPESPGWAAYDW